MRILVVGNGGREHAIAWKLSQGDQVKKVFVAPGNPGTACLAKCQNVAVQANDLEALVGFASTEGIDLTIVGPEKPLADGLADLFFERDLAVFGPSRKAAALEASKKFAKEIMQEAGVPTASFEVLRSARDAYTYLAQAVYPLVLKADGLAAGKGVSICPDQETARDYVYHVMEQKVFGDAGNTVVAEEFLKGEEVSFLVVADGTRYVPLAGSQDHKRLLEGDEGPNTGGMGAYSPAPSFSPQVQALAEDQVVKPVLSTMSKKGIPFLGILYVGLVLTAQGPKVLEFNVRFGDPETQSVLPRLDSDLAELLYTALRGRLDSAPPRWKEEAALTVVLASEGYPLRPKKGVEISGVKEAEKTALVFHAGTKQEGQKLVTSGGRVFGVTGLGTTLKEAAEKAYAAADRISFSGKVCRRDIGWRALKG